MTQQAITYRAAQRLLALMSGSATRCGHFIVAHDFLLESQAQYLLHDAVMAAVALGLIPVAASASDAIEIFKGNINWLPLQALRDLFPCHMHSFFWMVTQDQWNLKQKNNAGVVRDGEFMGRIDIRSHLLRHTASLTRQEQDAIKPGLCRLIDWGDKQTSC